MLCVKWEDDDDYWGNGDDDGDEKLDVEKFEHLDEDDVIRTEKEVDDEGRRVISNSSPTKIQKNKYRKFKILIIVEIGHPGEH